MPLNKPQRAWTQSSVNNNTTSFSLVIRSWKEKCVPVHWWFLRQGKLAPWGNIQVLATHQICTLLCYSNRCIQICQTIIFLQPYCHHWNKSCNRLISHTPALSTALQPISFSVVHHKIQFQLTIISAWVVYYTKIAEHKFLTSGSHKHPNTGKTNKNAFTTFPCKYLSSPHKNLHLLGSKFML